VGSAFLNNTPLVAMFIPVIRDLAKISRLQIYRLCQIWDPYDRRCGDHYIILAPMVWLF
jgi:hypothetical protein